MSENLVSIITPSYNSASFILKTIDSVVKQTYLNWEMIIVDDCSTDNTVEVVNNYIEENDEKRIKVFVNEKNSGAAYSRNRAIREAKGHWIAFIDSDDLWDSFKLEEQIMFMKNNNYHFSNTYYRQVGDNGDDLHRFVISPKKMGKQMIKNYCWLGCLTVIYDASYVGLIQIPDNIKKRNDYAMWLKVAEKAKCYCYPKICASYRIRSGSISRVSKRKLLKHHQVLFKSIYNCSTFKADIYTLNNMFWGTIKKFFFVKKSKNK